MNIFAQFSQRISQALVQLYPDVEGLEVLAARATSEPPRDAAHGDISSNVAMVSAKLLGKKPRDIAEQLVAHFASEEDVVSVEVAGPGFLNFRLTDQVWQNVLRAALEQGEAFGKPEAVQPHKVNVEYVSANPTGPMHVGHTRGAVFGDALAALLEFSGHDVSREYYINDAGSQMGVLARSAHLRYREALGEDIGEIPAGFYPGDYLVPVGRALAQEFGDSLQSAPESEWFEPVKERVLTAMLELIRSDLAALGVTHEVFFSEKSMHGQGGEIDVTLDWLRKEGLVYEGRLAPPKGKELQDWEDREQTLFRASNFGDDVDRPLIKSDRSYTYFAADIAYARSKYLRGFNDQIIVLGADHSGYVKRLQAAVKAVSGGEAEIDVKVCQLVRLMRDGTLVKMSKRSGELVTLADVVEEVGVDAVRFMLLFRRNDAAMDFDFAKVAEQTRDNPVFYVQYAHARACSVARTAVATFPDLDISPAALKFADVTLVSSPEEIELLRVLAQWPRLVASAAASHEPHRIAFYIHELAGAFHAFWARGKENPKLRFVNDEDIKITLTRLAMVEGVRSVLSTGLGLLGVSAPQELS